MNSWLVTAAFGHCDTSAGEERAWAADHTVVMQLAEPQECDGILIKVRWSPVQSLLLDIEMRE